MQSKIRIQLPVSNGRKPSVGLALVRVVVISIALALLAFVISLFLAVAGILLADMIRGGGTNLALAYRHIAFPIAIVVLVVAFVLTLRTEMRHLRRLRAQTTYRRAA